MFTWRGSSHLVVLAVCVDVCLDKQRGGGVEGWKEEDGCQGGVC